MELYKIIHLNNQLINMLIKKTRKTKRKLQRIYICDRNKFLSMVSHRHNLSAALRANAQKKNCYRQSRATFLRIVFYSPLRIHKKLVRYRANDGNAGSLRSLTIQRPTRC